MSPQSFDDDYRLTHLLPKWCCQLGLQDLGGQAADLAQRAIDDPFELIEYVLIGAHCFGADFRLHQTATQGNQVLRLAPG